MAWQDAVINAAIEQEEAGRQVADPQPERETRRGDRGNEAAQQKPKQPKPPELGKTQGEIRLARTLTATAKDFADALEDRGYILAKITPADIAKDLEKVREEWEQRRQNPQSGMEHDGGFKALKPEFQESARRSYDQWISEKQEEEPTRRAFTREQDEKAFHVMSITYSVNGRKARSRNWNAPQESLRLSRHSAPFTR